MSILAKAELRERLETIKIYLRQIKTGKTKWGNEIGPGRMRKTCDLLLVELAEVLLISNDAILGDCPTKETD